MAPTVAFCTLGCKVNQYDSQAMLERLESAGYTAAPFSAPCDVYVVNTCTVTGTGDKKSRQMIRRAAREHPGAAIVVTGCAAGKSRSCSRPRCGRKNPLSPWRRWGGIRLLRR